MLLASDEPWAENQGIGRTRLRRADNSHARGVIPRKAEFPAFLSFLSCRFSLSDLSAGFLALGFRGDLSGMRSLSALGQRYTPEPSDSL